MTIRTRKFGNGDDDVVVVTISTDTATAQFLDVGATLWQVHGWGTDHSLCLHHADPFSYFDNPPYLGCTVGPVANRIAGSRFAIGGDEHRLVANEGANHLHGGPTGFGRRRWELDVDHARDAVSFRMERPHGEGGYPGHAIVDVTWSIDGDDLRFEWSASADRATPVSIANHAYWNLDGRGTIDQHRLRVAASQIVEIDDELLPTGRLIEVAGTPYDLNAGPILGAVIDRVPDGIDHNYVLDPRGTAELVSSDGRLSMTVSTSLPGLQVYTGHQLDGSAAQGGYAARSGLCLETQFFPDAVNQSDFTSPKVGPGETMSAATVHRFHRSLG